MAERDKREYGLSAADRAHVIHRTFGPDAEPAVLALLAGVTSPTEQVLGAIVFLAGRIEEIPDLVELANSDRDRLLNAATVKDERS